MNHRQHPRSYPSMSQRSDVSRISDCHPEYASDSFVDKRVPVSGLTCTGDLDYPAAKSLNVLAPITKQKRPSRRYSGSRNKVAPLSECFESKANKVYTKEFLSSNILARAIEDESTSTYIGSTFEDDLVDCAILQTRMNGTKLKETNLKRTTSRPRVRFSNVRIQEYSIEPGDNPGGNKGCPLTIGWEPINSTTFDIDVFESVRDFNRRPSDILRMVSAHREELLRGMGYRQRDIRAATRDANRARRNRFQTIARLDSAKSEEALEVVRKGLLNLVTFKKRRENAVLAPYQRRLQMKDYSSSNNSSYTISTVSDKSAITENQ